MENQFSQEKALVAKVSLQRDGWDGKMGWLGRDRGQLDSYRQTFAQGELDKATAEGRPV